MRRCKCVIRQLYQPYISSPALNFPKVRKLHRNIGTPCTCSHKVLGLGHEAFQTIFKNDNPGCDFHTFGKLGLDR